MAKDDDAVGITLKAHVDMENRKKPSITRGEGRGWVIELTDGRKGGDEENQIGYRKRESAEAW